MLDDLKLCLSTCSQIYKYSYDYGGKKQCVTAEECVRDKNGYLEGEKCVPECSDGYAYTATGSCLSIPPSTNGGFANPSSGFYDCGEKYLDVTGSTAKCIEKTTCTGILYESKHLCVTEEQCASDEYDGYLYDAGKKKKCISLDECGEANGFVYLQGQRECSAIEPDPGCTDLVNTYQ